MNRKNSLLSHISVLIVTFATLLCYITESPALIIKIMLTIIAVNTILQALGDIWDIHEEKKNKKSR